MKVFGDGGCRERIRGSARRLRVLREVFGEVPELFLESLGASGSDVRAPRIDSELRFLVSETRRDPKLSTKLLWAATIIIFEHTETIRHRLQQRSALKA